MDELSYIYLLISIKINSPASIKWQNVRWTYASLSSSAFDFPLSNDRILTVIRHFLLFAVYSILIGIRNDASCHCQSCLVLVLDVLRIQTMNNTAMYNVAWYKRESKLSTPVEFFSTLFLLLLNIALITIWLFNIFRGSYRDLCRSPRIRVIDVLWY